MRVSDGAPDSHIVYMRVSDGAPDSYIIYMRVSDGVGAGFIPALPPQNISKYAVRGK